METTATLKAGAVSAAAIAARKPAPPPPITNTSCSCVRYSGISRISNRRSGAGARRRVPCGRRRRRGKRGCGSWRAPRRMIGRNLVPAAGARQGSTRIVEGPRGHLPGRTHPSYLRSISAPQPLRSRPRTRPVHVKGTACHRRPARPSDGRPKPCSRKPHRRSPRYPSCRSFRAPVSYSWQTGGAAVRRNPIRGDPCVTNLPLVSSPAGP